MFNIDLVFCPHCAKRKPPYKFLYSDGDRDYTEISAVCGACNETFHVFTTEYDENGQQVITFVNLADIEISKGREPEFYYFNMGIYPRKEIVKWERGVGNNMRKL